MSNRIGLYMLVLGAFVMGTAELVVGGILDRIGNDLNISLGAAGQLVTAYSLAYAVGTPLIILSTSRVARKKLLIGSLLVFAAGSLVVPFTSNYAVLMFSRAVLGVSTGVFSVNAFSAAAKLVPPERTGSAIGLVALGISVANVLGVPSGVLIADHWGWRQIFVLLAGLSLHVAGLLVRALPVIEGDAPIPFSRQFAVLRNPVILSGLLVSVCFTSSASIVNTYMVPLLRDMLGMPSGALSTALLVIGLSGVIGSRVGGIGVDKQGSARMIVLGLGVFALASFALPTLRGMWVGGVTLTAIVSLALSLTIPAILAYFIEQEPRSANMVLSLNTSILHLGVAVGAALGGSLLNAAHTVAYHPAVAGSLAMLSLLAASVSFAIGRRLSRLKEGAAI